MSRRGAWMARQQAAPPHAIAARQQRGEQLAGRGEKKRDRAPIPASRRPAGDARAQRDGEESP